MSYVRFGLMIATSTLVMFALMYLNTYALEHMMGATMAVIMIGYMLGMYSDMRVNLAILAGASVVFVLSLWLVRAQATVSGPSYMRAMIPHHSIAIMTSERAQIRDPRVRHLAAEIIEAQRREIAEMRYLIGEISAGQVAETIYRDPPAAPGSVQDALGNTLISTLDLSPMPRAEADRILAVPDRCAFRRGRETHPVLWSAADGTRAAVKLNGVLVLLERRDGGTFAAPGLTVTVRPLGEEADWRADADLVFRLEPGLDVGYRGFWTCAE